MIKINTRVWHTMLDLKGRVVGYGFFHNPWKNEVEPCYLVQVDDPVPVPNSVTHMRLNILPWRLECTSSVDSPPKTCKHGVDLRISDCPECEAASYD